MIAYSYQFHDLNVFFTPSLLYIFYHSSKVIKRFLQIHLYFTFILLNLYGMFNSTKLFLETLVLRLFKIFRDINLMHAKNSSFAIKSKGYLVSHKDFLNNDIILSYCIIWLVLDLCAESLRKEKKEELEPFQNKLWNAKTKKRMKFPDKHSSVLCFAKIFCKFCTFC